MNYSTLLLTNALLSDQPFLTLASHSYLKLDSQCDKAFNKVLDVSIIILDMLVLVTAVGLELLADYLMDIYYSHHVVSQYEHVDALDTLASTQLVQFTKSFIQAFATKNHASIGQINILRQAALKRIRKAPSSKHTHSEVTVTETSVVLP